MNYRHAYHAGNHGDVLKHVLLTQVLSYFRQKESGFAVLDAHAGIGVYDLLGLEAFKTGEWKSGIARLLSADLPGDASALLDPYFTIIRSLNRNQELQIYPGSPEIARHMLRPQDRLLLNELHPADFETLSSRFAGQNGVIVEKSDALQMVKSQLPFREKRGILLVDPPFEADDETDRAMRILKQALRRMANLCVMLWYPVTMQTFADQFCEALPLQHVKSALRVELLVKQPRLEGGMAGSGVVVVNPPWVLFDQCKLLLPALANAMETDGQGRHTLTWLVQPQ